MSAKKAARRPALGTENISKLLFSFAGPSIIAMLVGALYNIVDQFFIGQSIGALGNAATNVAFPLTTSCIAITLLFGIGGASAFNLKMGEGDKEQAASYMGNAVVMLFASGVVLSVLVLSFLSPLLRFFGSPDNVLGYALTYTSITAYGFPFLIFANGAGHLIRADGSPRYMMFCNLSGAILNTILDAWFIFGLGLGMAGAAWATVAGQVLSAVLGFLYLRKTRSVKLTLNELKLKGSNVMRIATLGTSSFINQIAMMVVQVVMNQSLTYYGALSSYGAAIPLACVGIITKVNMIFFSICIGIAQGTQPIAGFNYGAKNYRRCQQVLKLALTWASIASVIAFAVFQLFPRQIIGLFGNEGEEYFNFAINYFRIFLFATFVNGLQPVASTFFTAIGKPKKGIFLSLTRQILFLLPLIVILPLSMGIDGIMYAGPAADFAAAAVAFVMIVREYKKLSEQALALENV